MTGFSLILTKKDLRAEPIHEWLGPHAANTILVSPTATRAAADPAARSAFAGWVCTPDYNSTVTELIAAELVLDFRIDRLASISEYDVVRAARLRQLGGLPGQDVDSALRYRDKWLMKRAAADHGVHVPRMACAETPTDLAKAVEEVGLPAVVKPTLLAGSEDINVLRTVSDLETLLRRLSTRATTRRLIVEEFVDAPLYHVDGLMRAGRVLTCLPSAYLEPPLAFVHDGRIQGSLVLDADDQRTSQLSAAAHATVAALGSPDHILSFHAEFFLFKGGQPILCEIASRTGGGGIPPMVEAVAGLNLRREAVRGQLGLPPSPQASGRHRSGGCVGVPPRGGALLTAPSSIPFDWTVGTTIKARPGTDYRTTTTLTNTLMLTTVVGDNRQQVADRIDEVLAWWHENTTWEL